MCVIIIPRMNTIIIITVLQYLEWATTYPRKHLVDTSGCRTTLDTELAAILQAFAHLEYCSCIVVTDSLNVALKIKDH